VALDIKNVLFTTTPEMMGPKQKMREVEERHVLIEMWNSFDTDGSGTLDYREVEKLIEVSLQETLEAEDTKAAFELMDADRSGLIELAEFKVWYESQNAEIQRRIQKKAFEDAMSKLEADETSTLLVQGSAGPELVQLVSPRGLFRLVMRSKCAIAKEFHQVQPLNRTPHCNMYWM
jgi:hypothetical protein